MLDLTFLHAVRDICISAGARIMEIYADDFDVGAKSDASPVTEADRQAEDIILKALQDLAPTIPAVAEEQVSEGHIPEIDGKDFWLIDPLDGTREFINRNGEFTVNVAVIQDEIPTLGVVYTPAKNLCHFGAQGIGAFQSIGGGSANQIAVRPTPPAGLTAMVSRSHKSPETDTFLENFNIAETLDAGSSLKLCRLAEGSADLYPRLGRTMEWDIAAGHAVLLAAGGLVETLQGGPLKYGKPGFENPHFVAYGTKP